MTLYGIEQKYRFGTFHFEIVFDSGNQCSLEQRDVQWSQPPNEPRWVRSFYFRDVNNPHMRAFCRRFAEDETYRNTCLEQQTDWAIRDRLFCRNIEYDLLAGNSFVEQFGGVPAAYEFFRKRWQAIVALETYQHIQRLDSAFDPDPQRFDPRIQDAVDAFNQIHGVKTKFSCQGVTQTIRYENWDILVDSPHARLGYIWFEDVPTSIESVLQTYCPEIACYEPRSKILKSTGDNILFRRTALDIALSVRGATL